MRQNRFISLDRLIQLEETESFISNYKNNDEEELHIGESLLNYNFNLSEELIELGNINLELEKINKRKQEILNHFKDKK